MNHRIALQVEMDQTSGKAAIELRACLITLEESKSRVEKAKASLALACSLNPVQCPALKSFAEAMIRMENRIQGWARIRWIREKIKVPSYPPLPDLDEISQNGFIEILLNQNGLKSGARIERNHSTARNTKQDWRIAWSR